MTSRDTQRYSVRATIYSGTHTEDTQYHEPSRWSCPFSCIGLGASFTGHAGRVPFDGKPVRTVQRQAGPSGSSPSLRRMRFTTSRRVVYQLGTPRTFVGIDKRYRA